MPKPPNQTPPFGSGKMVLMLAIDLDTGERSALATGLHLAIDHHDLPDNTPLGIAVPSNGAIYLSGGDNSILKITLRPE